MGEYKEAPEVQDARISLLSHYSSKSSNQTQILLGLSVAFFAAIQAYDAFRFLPDWLRNTIFILALGIIAYFTMRQTARLIYWGELATAITLVGMLDEKVTKESLDGVRKELRKVKKLDALDVVPTYILRLNNSSSRYVDYYRMKDKEDEKEEDKEEHRETRSLSIWVYRIIHNKWFARVWAIIIAAIWLLSLAFTYRLLPYF